MKECNLFIWSSVYTQGETEQLQLLLVYLMTWTYGLCMPPAFLISAERTSYEISTGAGRWGSQLASLWSESKASLHTHICNSWGGAACDHPISESFSSVSFKASVKKVKTDKGQNFSCNRVSTLKVNPLFLRVPLSSEIIVACQTLFTHESHLSN